MNSLRQVLAEYKSNHKALPAFNIDSFEIYQAIEKAVTDTNLPCIVQLSAGEDKFILAERLYLLVKRAQIEGLPIYLNMDHCEDTRRLEHLIKLGFDMVHLDLSLQDYQTNLNTTAEFIKKIRTINPEAIVEAEFNHISLADSQIEPQSFTNPSQAKEFIDKTQADLLAVSVGNVHGINAKVPEKLDLNLLKQIRQSLGDAQYLTLHGGSGVSIDDITSAINLGIVKININTDLRLGFKQSLNQNLAQIQSEKIYELLNPVIEYLENIVKSKLLNFSSANV